MRLYSLLLGFLWLHVGCHEELGKQNKEREDVRNVAADHLETDAFAFVVQQIRSLRHHSDELDHLHHSKARFPPDRKRLSGLGHFGVHANEVVGVHNSVDKSVQNNCQINITIIVDMGIEPVKEEDGDVVIDMEERKLTPLFAEDDKDSIPKVPNLGYVEEPEEIGQRRVLLVVSNARKDGVVITVGQEQSLNRHVCAQHDLRDVVNELDRVWVDSRDTKLHDLRSDNNKEKVG